MDLVLHRLVLESREDQLKHLLGHGKYAAVIATLDIEDRVKSVSISTPNDFGRNDVDAPGLTACNSGNAQ